MVTTATPKSCTSLPKVHLLLVEVHQQSRHVVATHAATDINPRRQQSVQQLLRDLRQVSPLCPYRWQPLPAEIHNLLIRLHLPDPVAAHDDELIVRAQFYFNYIRVGGDHLISQL